MRRETRLIQLHRPYAVDLGSLRKSRHDRRNGGHYWRAEVDAVWFRRRSGITVACIGTLWDSQDYEPTTATQFLERHTDGRYGGAASGRWDGFGYWGDRSSLDTQEAHLVILRPMLEQHPAVPAGYDGWWTFL